MSFSFSYTAPLATVCTQITTTAPFHYIYMVLHLRKCYRWFVIILDEKLYTNCSHHVWRCNSLKYNPHFSIETCKIFGINQNDHFYHNFHFNYHEKLTLISCEHRSKDARLKSVSNIVSAYHPEVLQTSVEQCRYVFRLI